MNRFDDKFRDMDSGWQGDDGSDDLTDVAGPQDQLSLFFGDRDWTLFEDRRVDFTGVDIGDSDTFGTDFVSHASSQSGHRKFARGIGHTAEGKGPFAGDARNIDNGSAVAGAHFGQGGIDHVVSPGSIDRHDIVPLLGEHLTDGAIFDVDPCGVDQDVDPIPLLAYLVDKVLDAGPIGHI